MKWSSSRTLVAGLVVIAATNAIALAGAAYNRSGAPGSVLVLTERELYLSRGWGLVRDNSGIELRIGWRVPQPETESDYGYEKDASWLDENKLRDLGFDLSYPLAAEDARRYYDSALPRSVLLVLELDGAAHAAAVGNARKSAKRAGQLLANNPNDKKLAKDADSAAKRLKREETEASRLFAIDAGIDASQLRQRYPDKDRYAIVRGRVRMSVTGRPGLHKIEGFVDELDVDRINVSTRFRDTFGSILENRTTWGYAKLSPFEVTVAYGRRFEPWVTAAAPRQ